MTRPTRRGVLLGGGAVAVGAGAAAAGWQVAPDRVRRVFGGHPDWFVPDAAEGTVRLESVASAAMGGQVDLFTAVPAGFGDGAGLPVVVILHGASASAADFRGFGFARFLTAAVEAGAPPFVLAGTDDGPAGWLPADGADPARMVHEELPGWLEDRGFDADRRAVWGWSRGGYGALRLALEAPDWARGRAFFSPAVSAADPALADLSVLDGSRLAFWCGTDDGFYDDVRSLVDGLPEEPEVVVYEDGGHTRVFWNDHTLEAFAWLADALDG